MSQFNINLIWDSSVLSQPNAAQIMTTITAAAQVFASNYSNPVTLNLHVGWGESDGNALTADTIGESDPNLIRTSYGALKSFLPSLPAGGGAGGRVDVTDLQAAAIGLSPNGAPVDGYIGFSAIPHEFIYSPSDEGTAHYFLADVFNHEVTELMGRLSSVGDGASPVPTVLDLYRYSAPGVPTTSPYAPYAYFSRDGGVTNEATFNADPNGDSGDWSSVVSSDALDAFAPDRVAGYFSQADQDVMTALGWQATSAAWDGAFINSETEAWLGRAANSGDYYSYASELANGTMPDALRTQLLQSGEGQAHTNAVVTSLYDTYLGRDPTPAEASVWQGLVLAGDDFTAVRSAILTDPAGRAHTDGAIKTLYETWFGRDPKPAEMAVWEGLIAGGQDFTGLRLALVNDPASHAQIDAHVTALYETWMGRDPSAGELSTWEGLVRGGDDLGAVRATLIADAGGQSHIAATVTSLYQSVLVRAPTAGEIAVWEGLFAGGDSFSDLSAALGQVKLQTEATIPDLYQTYLGRAPTAAEVTFWDGQVDLGATTASIRQAIITDPSGQAFVGASVASLYETWFGRAPTADELSVWDGLIEGGATFATLRSALVNDPAGKDYIGQTVTALYESYLSRAPFAYEAANAQWQIASGYSFNDVADGLALLAARVSQPAPPSQGLTAMFEAYLGRDPTPTELANYVPPDPYGGASLTSERQIILESAEGQAYFAHETPLLFETYLGRDPSASELSSWRMSIYQQDDYAILRAALLLYPEGKAHTATTVTSLYDTYFGRDPTASELGVWQGLITGGADFGTLRSALVHDPAGASYAAGQITSLYDVYFQRDPSASEIGVWQDALAKGATFDTVRDTLERDPGASPATVTGITVSPHQTVAFDPAKLNVVAFGFDPATDALGFHAADFAGVNFLDAAHARQITAADGSSDVLITVDATHSFLLEHTQLSHLSGANFLFS